MACDHYRRYAHRVGHMRHTGLGAYRFSMARPHVLPAPGCIDPAGLDFSSRLAEAAARPVGPQEGRRMLDFRSLLGKGSFAFFRHGESQGNRDGAMQGRLPSTLTDRGREQARAAGAWLARRPPELILTSPLARARETAEIIARECGIAAAEPIEELTEIDTGIFTGLTWAEAAERHPAAHRELERRSWDGVPGAETSAALYERAEALWSILFRRFEAGSRRIACVTHSGFLQWIIRSTMGWRSWMPLISASGNCHVSELVVDNKDLGGGARSLYAAWVRINAPPAGEAER